MATTPNRPVRRHVTSARAIAEVVGRRRFLAMTGALGAGLVSGCSSDPEPGPGTTTVAPSPSTTLLDPQPYDPSQPYWLQGNFAPVSGDLMGMALDVEGSIPPSLEGVYVRNGSNPHVLPTAHWFFGDGMLHSVELSGGAAVAYRASWVDTPFLAAEEAGFTQPPGGENSLANVSVVHHAGRLMALGEVGWPVEVDPSDLSTLGPIGMGGDIGANVTAHPKVDPGTGHLHFFGYGFTPPYLTYYEADASGGVIRVEPIDLPASVMVHDFAITESDVVFWEAPVMFDLAGGREGVPFAWDPTGTARVGVMPLGGAGSDIRWAETDLGFCFHGTNARRVGDEVVLDLSVLSSAFAPDDVAGLERPTLERWTVDTSGDIPTWRSEALSDRPLDFPMIDRRWTGREHGDAWYVQVGTDGPGPTFVGIVHRSSEGVETAWMPGERYSPGEPFFVPEPDAGRGEGWILSYVHDRGLDRSSLAILDATAVDAGPVAWVHLPRRVPYGFHGEWVPAAALA